MGGGGLGYPGGGRYFAGRYASYWNAFLCLMFTLSESDLVSLILSLLNVVESSQGTDTFLLKTVSCYYLIVSFVENIRLAFRM